MKSFTSGVNGRRWGDEAPRLVSISMTLILALFKAVKENELGQNLGKELRQLR